MPQDSDATPFFGFYDEESQLTFVWDGKAPVIEVTHRGLDAVVGEIPVVPRTGIANASADRWMQWFKLVCVNYIRLRVGEKERTE